MRNFIKKLLLFSLPLFLLLTAAEVLLRNIPTNYSFKKEYLDAHPNDIHTLILGSSHTFFGLNPIYFTDKKTFNVANFSQDIYYDNLELRQYLRHETGLRTVVLPISYFTLGSRLSTSIEAWRVKSYVLYWGFWGTAPLSDHLIIDDGLKDCSSRLISYYENGKSELSCSNYGWGVGYKSTNSQDLIKTGKEAALRHTEKNKTYLDPNIKLLDQILYLCKKHNVKVILFTPPAYYTYRKYLNRKQLAETINVATAMTKKYNNCIYVNMLADPSFIKTDFYNADHVNEIGARKLSLKIDSLVTSINSQSQKP